MRRLIAALLPLAAGAGLATPADAAPSLDGVYRTDGYGQVLHIVGGHLSIYDTTTVNCLPAGRGVARAPRPDGTRFVVPGDDAVTIRRVSRRTAVEHVDSATSVRLLHRIGHLPAACVEPPARGPVATFDAFWATFAENYPFFALHHVDWTALRARYRPQVSAATTPEQLRQIFTAMLEPLHDAHVALIGPDGLLFHESRPGTQDPTPALDAQTKAFTERVDLRGAPLREYANGRISFAALPDGTAYLRVSGFTGYTAADTEPANRVELARVLDTVFAGAAHWHGLLVDLRVNGGGSDALALDLAARLTDRPYAAYAKQYWRGTGWSAPQRATVSPAAAPTFTGPIALLVSGSTVSAGETFTQALLARTPRPAIVGENTQGVFSDTLDRPLPNGWTAILPNERYLTADGRSFDGTGIPATVAEPFVTTGSHDPLFTAALAAVRR